MSEITIPRRSVMFTLAAASLASACTNSSTTLAPLDAGEPKDSGGTHDAELLNGLLSDEYQAIEAYAAAAPYLQRPDKSDSDKSLAPVVLAIAVHFSSEHSDHADALVSAIKKVGGTPVKQSSVKYKLPSKFTASVMNILKLAANAERAAAVVYNQTIGELSAGTNRLLAAAISGDEAQHFTVLAALIEGLVTAGSSLSASTADDVVPTSFVAGVTTGKTLSDIADFSVNT